MANFFPELRCLFRVQQAKITDAAQQALDITCNIVFPNLSTPSQTSRNHVSTGVTCLGWFVYGMVFRECNLSTKVGMETRNGTDWIVLDRLGFQACSTPACSVKPGQKSTLLSSKCTVIVSRFMPQEYFA